MPLGRARHWLLQHYTAGFTHPHVSAVLYVQTITHSQSTNNFAKFSGCTQCIDICNALDI